MAWKSRHDAFDVEIIYQDDDLVVINKPSGLLVHPSAEAVDRVTCLSIVRDMIGRYVYPLHRLDRGTSGVLILATSNEATRLLQGAFARREVHKVYLAIVRGWTPDEERIDRALKKRNGKDDEYDEAVTHYRTLGRATVNVPVGRYPEARYSLVEARPVTGRRHQIRRHLSTSDHPIVGDTVHGDGRHNRLFRGVFDSYRLLLHALRLTFVHPMTHEEMELEAPLPPDFLEVCERLGWGTIPGELVRHE